MVATWLRKENRVEIKSRIKDDSIVSHRSWVFFSETVRFFFIVDFLAGSAFLEIGLSWTFDAVIFLQTNASAALVMLGFSAYLFDPNRTATNRTAPSSDRKRSQPVRFFSPLLDLSFFFHNSNRFFSLSWTGFSLVSHGFTQSCSFFFPGHIITETEEE